MKNLTVALLVSVVACTPVPGSAPQPQVRASAVSDDEVYAACHNPKPECEALCTGRQSEQACSRIANFYSGSKRWNLPKDPVKALEYKLLSCDYGNSEECLVAEGMIRLEQGAKRDPARQMKLLETACGRGNTDGCYRAGVMLFTGPLKATDPDAVRASQYLEKGEGWLSLDAIYRTWLLRDCTAKLPRGKDACLKDVALSLAVVDKIPELDEESRTERRNDVLRASCVGVPRPECAKVPPEPEPPAPSERE